MVHGASGTSIEDVKLRVSYEECRGILDRDQYVDWNNVSRPYFKHLAQQVLFTRLITSRKLAMSHRNDVDIKKYEQHKAKASSRSNWRGKGQGIRKCLRDHLCRWISTAELAMENCFPYDYFTNSLGFGSKQIDLQNALCELNSKGIDLNIAPIRSEWMECEPVDLDP